MAKKREPIRRLYEKGREITLSSFGKKRFAGEKKKPVKKESQPLRHIPKTPFVDTYHLPPHYGRARLTLMVKDPFWIYSYWEIPPDSLEPAKKVLGNSATETSKIVLRMYDVTLVNFNGFNANHYFDLEVGNASNWYINIWQDSVSYIGEVGLRASDGRFFPLARSNAVQTPRSSYSPRSEQIWMKVEHKEHSVERTPYVASYPAKEYAKETPKEKDTVAKQSGRRIYLSEDEIKNYYAKINPKLRDVIAERLGRLYRRKSGKYGISLEGDSELERNRILAHLPRDLFVKRILIGSSESLVLLGGASENLIKGASDFVGEKPKDRHFFFELATELIVYGRTEPNAEVWLGDKKVKLDPDGSFNLRLSLPDGKIPLKFKAVSHDKVDTKKIETHIERKTSYGER